MLVLDNNNTKLAKILIIININVGSKYNLPNYTDSSYPRKTVYIYIERERERERVEFKY